MECGQLMGNMGGRGKRVGIWQGSLARGADAQPAAPPTLGNIWGQF